MSYISSEPASLLGKSCDFRPKTKKTKECFFNAGQGLENRMWQQGKLGHRRGKSDRFSANRTPSQIAASQIGNDATSHEP